MRQKSGLFRLFKKCGGALIFLLGALLFTTFFLTGCSSPGRNQNRNLRPDWIASPPSGEGAAVGAASYEIFGETNARERAVMKALTSLALQKGGTVDLESSIDRRQVLSADNAGESFREHASINTRAVVRGKEIPINAKVKAFWKDIRGKRIWVLIVEE